MRNKMRRINNEIMRKEFDYYIYVDYSEDLVGYTIIEKSRLKELLPRISKLHHYKGLRHKREYLSSIKKRFKNNKIMELLFKWEIKKIKDNVEVFVNVIEFIKKNDNCLIFLSVDNNQYKSFMKLLEIVPHQKNIVIVNESNLKKNSIEYQMSLIVDTMLNIERRKK